MFCFVLLFLFLFLASLVFPVLGNPSRERFRQCRLHWAMAKGNYKAVVNLIQLLSVCPYGNIHSRNNKKTKKLDRADKRRVNVNNSLCSHGIVVSSPTALTVLTMASAFL